MQLTGEGSLGSSVALSLPIFCFLILKKKENMSQTNVLNILIIISFDANHLYRLCSTLYVGLIIKSPTMLKKMFSVTSLSYSK